LALRQEFEAKIYSTLFFHSKMTEELKYEQIAESIAELVEDLHSLRNLKRQIWGYPGLITVENVQINRIIEEALDRTLNDINERLNQFHVD
jgi:hypothetical protein